MRVKVSVRRCGDGWRVATVRVGEWIAAVMASDCDGLVDGILAAQDGRAIALRGELPPSPVPQPADAVDRLVRAAWDVDSS